MRPLYIPSPNVHHGDYLIVAEYLGRRSDAVLGVYGWNICWRQGRRRQLRWRTVSTRIAAERAVLAAVGAGAK